MFHFRKKDLKNIENIGPDCIFENQEIKELYNDYKNKSPLDIRICMCINEEYFYLDLSEMSLDDNTLNNIFENPVIQDILFKIEMLDLSNNNLETFIDINKYTNIKFLNISNNNIQNIVKNDHLIELNCENNKIIKIFSISLIRLIAFNNLIDEIDLPNIIYLIIYNNNLKNLCHFNTIETLDCKNNNFLAIDYIKSLKCLSCSTNKISKIYSIKNIKKIHNNYYIDFN